MPCCKCGGRHVEHRELQLCSSCNRARRAGENPLPVKAPKAIAAVSLHRAAALKVQKKAYATITAKCCEACGRPGKLDNSHVLTQKQFPQHRANPFNILKLCRDDHEMWEHKKLKFRAAYPEVWATSMHVMQELEPQYYEEFKVKHNL